MIISVTSRKNVSRYRRIGMVYYAAIMSSFIVGATSLDVLEPAHDNEVEFLNTIDA